MSTLTAGPPAPTRSEAPRTFEANLEFRAMGTAWRIGADGVAAGSLEAVRALVEREEQRCSRFRADSELSRLNVRRESSDRTLTRIIHDALRVSIATNGAFDPTLGAAVAAAGYDRSFELLGGTVSTAPPSRPTVEIAGTRLRLRGAGALDLGGIAKGWTADRVGELLTDADCSRWLVDAGGDILIGGRPGQRVEEPIAVELTGLTVGLEAGAVATSSTLRRAWNTPLGRMHHIISPHTARPTRGAHVLATVMAPSAALADALATAMLVDAAATVAALPRFEAEALLFDDQGGATMTPGMERHLR